MSATIGAVVVGQRKARIGGRGAIDEQHDGAVAQRLVGCQAGNVGGQRQRWQPMHGFAGDIERLARRGEYRTSRRGRENRRHELGRRLYDVFAVIEDDEQLLGFEPVRNRLVNALALLLAHA